MKKPFDFTALLKRIPLFSTLPDPHIEQLVQICGVRKLAKDQVLFAQGSVGSDAYVIVSGAIRIVASSPEGSGSTILAIRKPGDVLGEMSILDRQPRSASAVAEEGTRLLVLRADDFSNLVARNPDVGFHIMRSLSLRLRELSALIAEQRLEGLDVRLVRYLETHMNESREVRLRGSQGLVARELGCTREALNRNLRRLELSERLTVLGRNWYRLT